MKSLPFTREIWELKLPILQAGGEAQTRRLEPGLKEINKEPDRWKFTEWRQEYGGFHFWHPEYGGVIIKPRHHVGEIACVPEAWAGSDGQLWYKAAFGELTTPNGDKWRSPRFMPAWAARWFVQVTGVLPQRVQEITPVDCILEGVTGSPPPAGDYKDLYRMMWDAAYPKHPFEGNPWEMTYRFRLVPRPEGV